MFHQHHFFPEFTLHFPNPWCKKLRDLLIILFSQFLTQMLLNVIVK